MSYLRVSYHWTGGHDYQKYNRKIDIIEELGSVMFETERDNTEQFQNIFGKDHRKVQSFGTRMGNGMRC